MNKILYVCASKFSLNLIAPVFNIKSEIQLHIKKKVYAVFNFQFLRF